MKHPMILACAALSACASRAANAPVTSAPTGTVATVTDARAQATAPSPTTSDAATASASRCPTEVPSPATVHGSTNECPATESVYVVHRWSHGEVSDGCHAPEWVMHLALPDGDVDRYFTPVESAEQQQRYRTITADELRAAELTIPHGPVWVFTANDTAPCQATIGAAWVGTANAGGPTYPEIGVELHGCAMPQQGDYVYAFISEERPAACRYRAMPTARTQGPTVPPTVRARVPSRACARPSCSFSWSLATVSIAGGVVDDVQALYTFPQRDVPECSYAFDWYHTVSWVPRAGAPWVRLEAAGPVTGVLYDGRGIRTVITDQLGHVRVFSIDGSNLGTTIQRAETRWFIANEEDDWTIRPSCL